MNQQKLDRMYKIMELRNEHNLDFKVIGQRVSLTGSRVSQLYHYGTHLEEERLKEERRVNRKKLLREG